MEIPASTELSERYVYIEGPELVLSGHLHMFAEPDDVLKQHFRRLGVPFRDRASALVTYWETARDWIQARSRLDYDPTDHFAFWPCDVYGNGPIVKGVELMREHADGVAFTRLDDDVGSYGFTFASNVADLSEESLQIHRDEWHRRLAIAYVCMGKVPPAYLVLVALRNEAPSLPEFVIQAFRASIRKKEERIAMFLRMCSRASALLDDKAPVPAPG